MLVEEKLSLMSKIKNSWSAGHWAWLAMFCGSGILTKNDDSLMFFLNWSDLPQVVETKWSFSKDQYR